MTALVTVADDAPGITRSTPATGFRAALALYPGCGMDHVKDRYAPYYEGAEHNFDVRAERFFGRALR
jgi:hypothetical protein